MRYIWLCGPLCVGKKELANNREKLKKTFKLKEPFIVRDVDDNAAPMFLLRAGKTPGITAVVQVWKLGIHAHLQYLPGVVPRNEVEVYILKPDVQEWRKRYAEKYSLLDTQLLETMWRNSRDLFKRTAIDFKILPYQYDSKQETED